MQGNAGSTVDQQRSYNTCCRGSRCRRDEARSAAVVSVARMPELGRTRRSETNPTVVETSSVVPTTTMEAAADDADAPVVGLHVGNSGGVMNKRGWALLQVLVSTNPDRVRRGGTIR